MNESSTNENRSVNLEGHGGHLNIRILDYENEEPLTESDGSWLDTEIVLEVEGCQARVRAAVTVQDLAHLHDELTELIANTKTCARLLTDEESIAIHVELGKAGSVAIRGELNTNAQAKVSTRFAFDSDRSFLQETVNELAQIRRAWPARTPQPAKK